MPHYIGEKMKHTPESLQRRKVRSTVDWSSAGQILINFLCSRFPYRDRNGWISVIENGEISINGKNALPESILAMHDIIEYQPGDLPEPPADMDYEIVFEDDDLMVIDKPGNLCVHPAGPFFKHTLWHMLCSKYGDIHFINRLDRETSGLMIAAKNKQTASIFAKKDLILKKVYTVMVYGVFPETLRASGFIYKDYNSAVRKKRSFSTVQPEVPSESAETLFELISSDGVYSTLRATLFTGRMHQIRATLCSLGYPVVGDKLYGPDESLYLKQKTESLTEDDKKLLVLPRQALHSSELHFIHPLTGVTLFFQVKKSFAKKAK
ncbi:MAG: RluA family pseudouridine synthase [Lentisphaerae bacterium]|nr:RluA family pseudouridine synthase [Lentisphaerota bacterium]